MQKHNSIYRAATLTSVAMFASAPVVAAGLSTSAVTAFEYHQPNVLGTVMNLTVVAVSQDDADLARRAATAEIQRLTKILSTYDADSEVARLNVSTVNGPAIQASPELIDILKKYDAWHTASDGAYSGHAGDLIALWKAAERTSVLPTDAQLLAAAKRCSVPAWEIGPDGRSVRRVSDQQINIDSIGKGYILDKAVAAATRTPRSVKGLLMDIGGDVRTWGSPAGPAGALWAVGVQDPAHPELNSAPLTTVYVPGNCSVSSSGDYQRFYTVDGKRYSHILDARTGKPGRNPAATVVAADSATANALATLCCSMKFTEGMALVRATPGAECLIVTSGGATLRTDGFKELQNTSLAAAKFGPKLQSQFPAGYKLSINLQTADTERPPYVFVWVTDMAGRHIKTLGAYGDDPRYWRDLREWWKVAQNDRKLQSMTHATQQAGSYRLAWDGTDQRGNGVPLGTYKVWVEVAAEHGPHSAKFTSITVGSEPTQATIPASSAFAAVSVRYGSNTPAGGDRT